MAKSQITLVELLRHIAHAGGKVTTADAHLSVLDGNGIGLDDFLMQMAQHATVRLQVVFIHGRKSEQNHGKRGSPPPDIDHFKHTMTQLGCDATYDEIIEARTVMLVVVNP